MTRLLLIGLLAWAGTANAMTAFLVAQWYENGNQMCRYSNGAVLNRGSSVCPLSIQG